MQDAASQKGVRGDYSVARNCSRLIGG